MQDAMYMRKDAMKTGLLPKESAKLEETDGAKTWKIKYSTTEIFMISSETWKYFERVGIAGKYIGLDIELQNPIAEINIIKNALSDLTNIVKLNTEYTIFNDSWKDAFHSVYVEMQEQFTNDGRLQIKVLISGYVAAWKTIDNGYIINNIKLTNS